MGGARRSPPGRSCWCDLDPPVGREQGGRRPCVVISSTDFSDVIDDGDRVVPCTTRGPRLDQSHPTDRADTGLTPTTYAITEQPRTMSSRRVVGLAGHVDNECLAEIMRWVGVWLHRAA